MRIEKRLQLGIWDGSITVVFRRWRTRQVVTGGVYRPRAELAAADDLTPADIEGIATRLARLDKASSYGAWTGETLRIIAEHPEVRAPDLAARLGRETLPFKLDVRKLKNLGLTLSFPV